MTGKKVRHKLEPLKNGRWRETTVVDYDRPPLPAEAVTGLGESYEIEKFDVGDRLVVAALGFAVLLSAIVLAVYAFTLPR